MLTEIYEARARFRSAVDHGREAIFHAREAGRGFVGFAHEARLGRHETTDTVVGGFDLWRGVRTPGQIRDEIVRIDSEVKSTGDDLMNLRIANPSDHKIVAFLDAAWTPFVTAWAGFAAGHESWTSNLWGTTWDQAQDYAAQLQAIRKSARDLGFQLITPDHVAPEPSGIEKLLAAVFGLFKITAYAALALAGLFGGVMAYRMIKSA